jgi:hypothetical protein
MSAFEGRPYELRKAGVMALKNALGDEDAGEFLELWRGIPGADFNKWLNSRPEKSLEELEEEIMRTQDADAETVNA